MKKIKKSICSMIAILIVIQFIFCQKQSPKSDIKIVDTILEDKKNFFYLDTQNYHQLNKTLPIGVFDSGTGGLTVLDDMVNFDLYINETNSFKAGGDGVKDFQEEYFIYHGDQANMPYGIYSKEGKTDLLKEHIIKDVQFLLDSKYFPSAKTNKYKTDKSPVKAIVIACNTATAYGKEDIENFIEQAGLEIKVIGVIGAGVRGALSVLKQDEDGSVAIMATAGTVASNGYVETLNKQRTNLNYSGDISVFQQAGIGLAGAIDGSPEYISTDATSPRDEYKGPSEKSGDAKIDMSILQRYDFQWQNNDLLFEGNPKNPQNLQINSVENYISYHLISLLEKIRKTPDTKPLKTIILGCTHYPFYTEIFQQKLAKLYDYQENGKFIYRPVLAENIELVDPAINTAKELYQYLSETKLFNEGDIYQSEFYISVPNTSNKNIQIDAQGKFTYEYKYGRKIGEIQQYVKRIPFSRENISDAVIGRLSAKVPLIFDMMQKFNRDNSKTRFLKENEKF
jgi:glutamate racemase